MLEAALNGSRSRADHPAVPLTAAEIVADAGACSVAGANAVHVHPRDAAGLATFDPAIVGTVASDLADGSRPVTVSTALEIAGLGLTPAAETARLRAIGRWHGVRAATVNAWEPGWVALAKTLLVHGIRLEIGVSTVADAVALAASPIASRLDRILVETPDTDGDTALATAAAIHGALDVGLASRGIRAVRQQHGEGASTWPVLVDAVRRGIDTRIGLEDTLQLPDGSRAADNAALVRAAIALGA